MTFCVQLGAILSGVKLNRKPDLVYLLILSLLYYVKMLAVLDAAIEYVMCTLLRAYTLSCIINWYVGY